MKILNRIVTFLLAVAVFPTIVVRVLLRMVISINSDSSAYSLASGILGDAADSAMEITMSIKDLVGYIEEGTFSFAGMDFSISKIPTEMLVTKNWAIAAAALLVLALLIALIIMGCALFTQAHKTVMAFAAGGMASCFAAIACFSKFAEPFLTGDIDVAKILTQSLLGNADGLISSLGSLVSGFTAGALSVDILQLGNAVITMSIIFLGILLWTFAYYITLSPEAKAEIKLGTSAKKAKAGKKTA